MQRTPERLSVRLAFLAKVVYQTDERSEASFAKLVVSERF